MNILTVRDPRNASKASKTGPKQKRRMSDNSQSINPIGIYENDSCTTLQSPRDFEFAMHTLQNHEECSRESMDALSKYEN
jgi:hypothetical protein